ncbi:Isochorismatase-like protein [Myxozyma melibiosi]|uniref:Isochorismatase-like protein n=1 Tax=Myxozyma melibiosi TaxID=54550 RepID=A0ABR1EYY9_9ASCO
MTFTAPLTISTAKPAPFPLPAARTALIIIDMQRDFVLPSGYGAIQCPSAEVFAQVSGLIGPCLDALRASRKLGMTVVHTREGHVPDLSDCPPTKTDRQRGANTRHFLTIGEEGPMGRLLVRGAYGHDIVDELKPRKDEVVLDKPGKGSFFNTDLHEILVARGITHILFAGVTAECCVASTFREANDHGFECCVLTDCTGGFNSAIVSATMDMFCAYDGLLGYASTSKAIAAVAADAPAGALAVSEPAVAQGSKLSLLELHKKYLAGETVSSTLESLPTPASSAALESAAALDKTSEVDIDGARDLSLLYGVPFVTTPEFSESSVVVQQMLDQGAVFLGSVPCAATAVASGAATFGLSTSSSPAATSPASFTVTKNSLSSAGVTLPSPSFSTFTIHAPSVLDARTLWSTLVRLQPTDFAAAAAIQHFRERPIVYVDYRGFETGGLRYAVYETTPPSLAFLEKVEKIFSKSLPGRKVDSECVSSSFASAAKLASCAESVRALESAPSSSATISALDTIKNMHALALASSLFTKAFDNGIESPDVLLAPYSDETFVAVEAVGGCAAVVAGDVVVVGAKGLDGRVLDIAVLAESRL